MLRARAHRSREIPQIASTANTSLNKSEKAAARKLTKRVLENQMRLKMRSLWDEVLEAEQGIDEGDPGALDQFIYAAGTMIENFRLARSNFSKSRVSRILRVGKLIGRAL